MSKVELAWAAGLYDGEGSTSVMSGVRPRDYPTLCVSIGQHHDPTVLYRFAVAVGIGTINGPYADHGNKYQYRALGDEAYKVLRKIWPYLSVPKQAQARIACATVNESFKQRRPYAGRLRHYKLEV